MRLKGSLGKLSYSVGKYVVLGKVLGARRSVYDPSEWCVATRKIVRASEPFSRKLHSLLLEGGVRGGYPVSEWRMQMTTKLIIIVAVSVAAVVLMFILGKLADGKDKDQEK